MEKKKSSLIVCLLIIAIAVIAVLLCYIYKLNSKLNTTISNMNANTSSTSTPLSTVSENNTAKNEIAQENTNVIQNFTSIIPSIYTATKKVVSENANYEVMFADNSNTITVKNGVPYLTVNNQVKEITGFNKKVIDITYGGGQDSSSMTFYFLMEDGTVEYASANYLKSNLSVEDKMANLTNIIRLQIEDAGETDGPGWIAVVATDTENNQYDLTDVQNVEKITSNTTVQYSPYSSSENLESFNGKKVIDIKDGMGQDGENSDIVFLLEDGSVGYVKNGSSSMTELKNIIKLQTVDVGITVDETGEPGWVTVVAFDNENNMYDLGEIID